MKKDDSAAALLGCVLLLISLPFSALWSGYVLSVLWGWFIVPTFEARPLAVLPAIGLALVVGYLTKQEQQTEDTRDKDDKIISALVHMFLSPLIALLFGWILHSFM